jgi:hypothetical protein
LFRREDPEIANPFNLKLIAVQSVVNMMLVLGVRTANHAVVSGSKRIYRIPVLGKLKVGA